MKEGIAFFMSMRGPAAGRRQRLLLAAVAAMATMLGGCAMSDDKLAGMLVAPGKFMLYSCPELAVKARELAGRQRELEGLMVTAGEGASGKLVSTLAYRPDYLAVRGEINDVQASVREKNCDTAAAAPPAPVSAGAAGTTESPPVVR